MNPMTRMRRFLSMGVIALGMAYMLAAVQLLM
jgi:hypothetical protein